MTDARRLFQTVSMNRLTRFEPADLVVALCDAGQLALAVSVARSLLGKPRQLLDTLQRTAKNVVVARHEAQPLLPIELLQDDLEPSRRRR